MQIKNNNERGFTIIETMIAVALFSIVILVGMDSLLNTTSLQKKSQDMRSILDNLSFIMEDMSRNIRTGYNYHCIDNNNPSLLDITTRNCAGGGWGISFKSSGGNQDVYAISNGTIQKSTNGGTSFVPLSSSEINIDAASGFLVTGAPPPPGDTQQPFVTIKLIGTITEGGTVIPFSLQTSVSQRLVDIVL